MKSKNAWRLALVAGAALVLGGSEARTEGDALRINLNLKARLRGVQEVPVVSTTAHGEFQGKIKEDGSEVSFRLSYADLEGDVLFAHIHLGQRGANGGVMVFLCGGGGKPDCPPAPATVTGTIVAADVLGPAGQGIAAGEFTEVLVALVSGNSYANVHSSKFPGGELRGQIGPDSN